jgi:Tfp pilus assembly protein PilX
LLLLALLGLIVLGVWARVRLSARMAATFATKQRAFAPAGAASRGALAALIEHKRALLASLDPAAQEATFSPTLAHWIRSPRETLRYARLVREENGLMGARASVGMQQAWWRPLHLALAYLFVLGLVIHVITVTFFAGYVAGGEPITWWHLRAW